MPDVFLSYAHADAPAARLLTERLSAQGLSVFSDFAIVAGEEFSGQIEKALSDSAAVVVLLSRNSSRSRWVDAEVRSALESRKSIIPVLLDGDATENWVWPLISDRHVVTMESNTDFDNVVAQVMKAVAPTGPAASAPIASSLPRTHLVSWLTLIIALLSGLVGALASWLAR
jgi:TIR domain-containing protein